MLQKPDFSSSTCITCVEFIVCPTQSFDILSNSMSARMDDINSRTEFVVPAENVSENIDVQGPFRLGGRDE